MGIVYLLIIKMPPMMQGLARSQCEERAHKCLKYIESSVTIAVGGADIDVRLFVNLRKFIEDNWMCGLCSVERGGALMPKHIQMFVRGTLVAYRC